MGPITTFTSPKVRPEPSVSCATDGEMGAEYKGSFNDIIMKEGGAALAQIPRATPLA